MGAGSIGLGGGAARGRWDERNTVTSKRCDLVGQWVRTPCAGGSWLGIGTASAREISCPRLCWLSVPLLQRLLLQAELERSAAERRHRPTTVENQLSTERPCACQACDVTKCWVLEPTQAALSRGGGATWSRWPESLIAYAMGSTCEPT
eukprot:891008-Pelagomonas_calceolata.AAC.4